MLPASGGTPADGQITVHFRTPRTRQPPSKLANTLIKRGFRIRPKPPILIASAAAGEDAMLRLTDISKIYGGKVKTRAVDGVSLEIGAG